jgi:predicted permease
MILGFVLAVANVLAPVVATASIGFVWQKTRSDFDRGFVGMLALNVAAPCLILSAFARPELELAAVGQVVLAASLMVALVALVVLPLLRWLGLAYSDFLQPLLFPNTGNLGLPLVFFALGDAGLVFALIFSNAIMAFHALIGVPVTSGQFSLKQLARNSMFVTFLGALALKALGWQLPVAVLNFCQMIGALVVPLMLMALGSSLASFKPAGGGLILGLSALRVGLGSLVGFAIAEALALPDPLYGAFVIQSGMPVAVLSYMMAAQHKRRPVEVAAMVLTSTAMAVALFPLIFALLRWGGHL